MSGFFGSVLRDRSGKFNRQDDFANLKLDSANDGYDFEDTYDGLGDQLDEAGDDFNDDTFGVVETGKDFDFSGKTRTAANALHGEHPPVERRSDSQTESQHFHASNPGNDSGTSSAPPPNLWAPTRSSPIDGGMWPQNAPTYERAAHNQRPTNSDRHNFTSAPSAAIRKFQTLEEVEAALLASSKPAPANIITGSNGRMLANQDIYRPDAEYISPDQSRQSREMTGPPGYRTEQFAAPGISPLVQRQMPPGMVAHAGEFQQPPVRSQIHTEAPTYPQSHGRSLEASVALDRDLIDNQATLQAQQQKNLRRAQKIGQMARYNGIMSNGDKNYVLKVQISQLVSEDPEADDFYYTVHSTLRGRSNVQQSLGHFEQTYLSRAGQNNRRGNRDKQNPMLKMQQQVQKIIASAKARPKSTSLAMEGSLGKLSFSRVRQPKQVLNVKMPEGGNSLRKQSKREALQNIETVYSILLSLEHTGRQSPADTASALDRQVWEDRMSQLTEQIWSSLHIMDNVDDSQLHPFIQLLQYAKGKKLIPRLYRTLSTERRLTLVTMIVAHLDLLDVVRLARYDESGNLPNDIREDIDLFSQTVLPPLLVFTSNASMKIVVGLLNMLLERNHIHLICMSKVGLSFMTMFISRAEILKQGDQGDQAESDAWYSLYNRMFSIMEGKFGYIFPPLSHQVDEIYPWQFLAACAVSASPDQQHALVNEARDRVLDNVQSSKSLPHELAEVKRSNVNLFLNAIGLDASQLEG